MSQENEGPNSATPEGLHPVKRKRGRPRKDDNTGLGSDGIKRRRRRKIAPSCSPNADNALLGQIVSGVLDGSFDAGYLLTVRVGNTATVLRGVVFEPGLSIPISSANDVAPLVKMFHRSEISLSVMDPSNPVPSFGPQVTQSEPKNEPPVKVLQRNVTSVPPKGSSQSKTNPPVEVLQINYTASSTRGPSKNASHADLVSPPALMSGIKTEKKTDVSRNENTRLQKGLPKEFKKVPLETEKPVELSHSEKCETAQALNSEHTAKKMVEILQENKTNTRNQGSSKVTKQEPPVEPQDLPALQVLGSALNTKNPTKILRESKANDVNQVPVIEAQNIQFELKSDQPVEMLHSEANSSAGHVPPPLLVKEQSISYQKLLLPQVSNPTVSEQDSVSPVQSLGKPVGPLSETKMGPREELARHE